MSDNHDQPKGSPTSPAAGATGLARGIGSLLRSLGGGAKSRVPSSGSADGLTASVNGTATGSGYGGKHDTAAGRLSHLLAGATGVQNAVSTAGPATLASLTAGKALQLFLDNRDHPRLADTSFRSLQKALSVDGYALPAVVWKECSFLLDANASSVKQRLGELLLKSCVTTWAAEASNSLSSASQREVFYLAVKTYYEARQEAAKQTPPGRPLSEAEVQTLNGILDVLTRRGKDVIGLQGLLELLAGMSSYIHGLRQRERLRYIEDISKATAPLLDPTYKTPFVRLPLKTFNISFDPSDSPAGLLTSALKYSFAQFTSAEVNACFAGRMRGVLASLGDFEVKICLELIDTTVKFGIIPPDSLEDAVKFVARVSGLEGRCHVLEVSAEGGRRKVPLGKQLAKDAHDVMRNLLKSPANQALKHLRAILSSRPDAQGECPVPLLVGATRCLRQAYVEHDGSVMQAIDQDMVHTLERYPSLLAMGMNVLRNNLVDALNWHNADVDAEVLLFLDERLAATRANRSALTFEEWDTLIFVLERLGWHVTGWEEKHASPWSIKLLSTSADLPERAELVSDGPTNVNVLDSLSLLIIRMLDLQKQDNFTGSHLRFFDYILTIARYLDDAAIARFFAFQKERVLASPGRLDWLQRLNVIISVFFPPMPYAQLRDVVKTGRHQAVDLLKSAHSAASGFPQDMNALLEKVILPFFDGKLPLEGSAVVVQKSVAILGDCIYDAIDEVEVTTRLLSEMPLASRLLQLLVKLCRSHSTAVAEAELSLHATCVLIRTMHYCITLGDRRAAVVAVYIFEQLMLLVTPAMPEATPTRGRSSVKWPPNKATVASSFDSQPASASLKARLAIWQCLTRLRADQDHRVWARQHLDLDALAASVGRSTKPSIPEEASSLSDSRSRGRIASQRETNAEASRTRSRTRSRSRSRPARSPSRTQARSRRPTYDGIWSLPDILLYQYPAEGIRSYHPIGLVSFDHVLMQDWSETMAKEDRDLDLLNAAGSSTSPVVLPVSEYITLITDALKRETEWEILAYVVCALPNQLANKHYLCGPNAARKLQELRRHLVETLQADTFCEQASLPSHVRRSDVLAIGYQWLATLVAYRHLFTKVQQNEMVLCFMQGLGKTPSIAKASIHALSMACYEFESSVSKMLPDILNTLVQILSTTGMPVHILELVASIGHVESLYANFTENDYRKVFAVAIQYLATHYSAIIDDPSSTAVPDDQNLALEHAFKQYVFTLSYYVIALWYNIVPVSERPKYVGFIVPRLLQAIKSLPEEDVAAAVCLDMIGRLAYSQNSPFTFQRTESHSDGAISNSWIIGYTVLTLEGQTGSDSARLTIRRPSGVARQTVSLQEQDWESTDILKLLHQQRDLFQSDRKHSIIAGECAETAALFDADPAFFILFLPPYSHINDHGLPVGLASSDAIRRNLASIDTMPHIDFHKIGILYVGPRQTTEMEILRNVHGSKAYMSFLEGLGELIRLRNCDIYTGGLDREADFDGQYAYVWSDQIQQIIFHVVTLMPTRMTDDPSCNYKKRHIGNDYVKIIYNDSGNRLPLDIIPGQFNFVNIIIEPHTPAGEAWRGPSGMTSNTEFFRVSMQKRKDMPDLGPLGAFKMVSTTSLAAVVRELALHANVFAQLFLQSVGIEGRTSSTRQRMEYTSTWRSRLQAIDRLRRANEKASAPAVRPADV